MDNKSDIEVKLEELDREFHSFQQDSQRLLGEAGEEEKGAKMKSSSRSKPKTSITLDQTIKTSHLGNLSCRFCNFSFKSNDELESHLKTYNKRKLECAPWNYECISKSRMFQAGGIKEKVIAIDRTEKGKKVLEILDIMSYFSSKNIPIEMFVDFSGGIEELESVVELLKQHSIVNLLQQNPTVLNISEPTQQAIRTILKEENKEEVTLRKALQLFQIGLESDNLDHALSTWCYATAYRGLIKEFYILPSSIVQKLGDCGRYEKAYSFGMKQLKVIAKLDDGKPSCLRYKMATYLLYKIGSLLLNQKKFEEALEICEDPIGYYGGPTSHYKNVKIFLRHAVEDGNLEATKFFIENKGTDDEICDSKTLMHCAVQGGNFEVIKFLVEEKGADVNAKNENDQVPLHYAAEKGYLDTVKYLLEKGADFHSIDSWCRTSVHYAAKQSNLDIVELLVERGVGFSSCDEDLGTPLHYAAEGGHLGVVKYLLERGTDISVENDDGQTPLCCAAEEGHLGVVKYLLEKGADVGARRDYARVPLHYAVERGHLDVVKYLVERGADIGARDNGAQVPLHYAAEGGHLDVAKYLVEKRAAINAEDRFGLMPLHYAAEGGYLDVVKYLIEKGVDANGDLDQVPLNHAVGMGSLDVIKYLVEKGADINAGNSRNEVPLHNAASMGRLDKVKYLVENGADVNARDSNDRTALHFAVYANSLSVVRFLIEKIGSDDQLLDFINQRTKEGVTALDLAKKTGKENIIRILDQALQKAPYTSIENH